MLVPIGESSDRGFYPCWSASAAKPNGRCKSGARQPSGVHRARKKDAAPREYRNMVSYASTARCCTIHRVHGTVEATLLLHLEWTSGPFELFELYFETPQRRSTWTWTPTAWTAVRLRWAGRILPAQCDIRKEFVETPLTGIRRTCSMHN